MRFLMLRDELKTRELKIDFSETLHFLYPIQTVNQRVQKTLKSPRTSLFSRPANKSGPDYGRFKWKYPCFFR